MRVPIGMGIGVGLVDVGNGRAAIATYRTGEDDRGAPVLDLLRQLLPKLEVDPTPRGDGAEEVVFQARIDGRRYTLVRADEPAGASRPSISPREREIVRLVARGLPNKVIAEVLDISLWTVATYLRRLFAKLGVSSRAELVARALGEGLLES